MTTIRYQLGEDVIRIRAMGLYQPPETVGYDFFADKPDETVLSAIKECLDTEEGYTLADRLDVENRIHLEPVAPAQGPFYLFCSISCEEDTPVVIRSTGYSFSLWINREKVLIRRDIWEAFNITQLTKGVNILVAEFPSLQDAQGLNRSLGIRISRYADEMKDTPLSLVRDNYTILDHAASVICEHAFPSFHPVFSGAFLSSAHYAFIFMLNDRVNYSVEQEVSVTFHDARTGDCFARTSCRPFCRQSFTFQENVPPRVLAIFTYRHRQGKVDYRYAYLYFPAFDDTEAELIAQARRRMTDPNLPEQLRLALEYYLCQYEELEDWREFRLLVAGDIQDSLSQAEGRSPIGSGMLKKVFFRSRLDRSVEYYTIYLPSDYTPSRRYPLIAIMNTNRYNEYARYCGMYDGEPVIAVDVSSRGFTLGSYVGEAAIGEILQLVKEGYAIDEDRVYFIGSSNGGYATWAHAQHYPHRMAGIVPITGGVYPPNIRNLYNLRVVNITSPSDDVFTEAYVHPAKELKKLPDYRGLLADDMIHTDLVLLGAKRQLIAAMLETRRDPWPRQIRYRTERHAHRRAYWAELHGIAFGKKSACMTVQARDDAIVVRTENATGITLTVPPYKLDGQVKVIINRRIFICDSVPGKVLHFIREKNGFRQSDSPHTGFSCKGMGLLQVYSDAMKVLALSGEEPVMDCARTFAAPKSNGVIADIHVRYPVFAPDTLPLDLWADNLIVVDVNSGHPIADTIREHLPIAMDAQGYTYKGKRYQGPYCIMQVIENPQSPGRALLYINASDKRQLRRNVFTRQATLPSYAYGLHPYWNNEALIFASGRYGAIYEWGMDPQDIDTK